MQSEKHAISKYVSQIPDNQHCVCCENDRVNLNFMNLIDKTLLDFLEPLAKLSSDRKQELADVCFIETVAKGINPLRMNVTQASQLIYLTKGDLGLCFQDDRKLILRGGSPAAKHSDQ